MVDRSVEKKPGNTKKRRLERALFDIVTEISGKNREQLREEIIYLQKHIGSDIDMFIDRRKLNWGPGGKARKTVSARNKCDEFVVEFRTGGATRCSLQQAAELVGTNSRTLATYLSRNGEYTKTVDLDGVLDVVTVKQEKKS